ncbi:MAG: aminodeoxychorismate/anthranilate synthase component II [Syntrophomonadaceae bacterium]|nr:aminodeoxychorismate/anthranilate synthase component II [Syntrophomonadaceae bacterium]
MLLLVDNYDSFTYNLAQLLGEIRLPVEVRRNDAVTPEEVEDLRPTHLVISPGPGTPEQAGNSLAICRRFIGRIPILGVCLGHQCLARAGGAAVVRAEVPVHGKTSRIYHRGEELFTGMPRPFLATRYHSLVVERRSLPEKIEVVAETGDGVVMGLRWRGTQAWGVQFHPESVLTPEGRTLLRNFLALREAR